MGPQESEPQWSQGLIVTRGRFTEDRMVALTGKKELPILLPSSPLAELICRDCHVEDHRLEVGQILARTRRSVWLVKGRMVARRVARGCMWCRRRKKEPVQQQIGRLPLQVAEIAPPFSHLALDLF